MVISRRIQQRTGSWSPWYGVLAANREGHHWLMPSRVIIQDGAKLSPRLLRGKKGPLISSVKPV